MNRCTIINPILLVFAKLCCVQYFVCSLFVEAFRPPPLSSELGCSPTLSILLDRQRYLREEQTSSSSRYARAFFYFDPWNIATDDNFARLRESELKHGRIAMLATLEIMLVPIWQRLQWLSPDFPQGIYQKVQSPILQQQFPQITVQILSACALLELFIFVQKDPTDMPGDYGTGYFGLRDKTLHENQLIVELEHGRLAMIGILGFVTSDILTNGQPWTEQWNTVYDKILQQFQY